ncbi:PEP-CTERM sorting domain-containing protein, partial [Roseiarcus sp.]|uniref:PEP-CTERM sorting domain-containing protein n=1 Tax=Roseiarcus sp. TaxID=1969460 RepID=UPI003C3CB42A
MRKHLLLAALFIVAIALTAGPSSAQVTLAQATAFFKDFDEQALSGKGPDINAVYLPGVAAPTAAQIAAAGRQYADDMNEVMAASAARYAIEVVTAAGNVPTAAQTKALADALKKATNSGALNRVSTLQFTIMQKHFPNAANNGVDFAKMQMAMNLFANGQLRVATSPGTREMDQLWSWYNWKNVAALAIQANVQKASWTSLLPSVEIGLEIYREAYPLKPLAEDVPPAVTTSEAKAFKAPIANAAIAAIAGAVNPLTTAQILAREQGNLKTDTKVALAGPPSNGTVTIVSATETPAVGGERVSLLADVTDPTGMGLNGDQLEYMVSEDGLELGIDAFWTSGFLTGIGGGEYEASFLAPGLPLGLVYWVSDDNSMSIAAGTIPVPEPSTLTMLGAGATLMIALGWRRKWGFAGDPRFLLTSGRRACPRA